MRKIKSAGKLAADVEGDIEDVDGVLRITKLRLRYRIQIAEGERPAAERAVAAHAELCAAYQSVVPDLPTVLRLQGTNAMPAWELLHDAQIPNLIIAESLTEAARKAVERARALQ